MKIPIDPIRTLINHPNRVLRELNRRYYRIRGGHKFFHGGIGCINQDWDNLLLLDACRYDLFRDEADLPGTLSYRYSMGSHTTQFVEANLGSRELHDVVYVTASPMYHNNKHRFELDVHAVVDLWKTSWNEQYGTVLPETVTERVLEIIDEYPHKRILAHYIQPHYPFIDSAVEEDGVNPDEHDIWRKRMEGELKFKPGDVWPAYRSNLRRALPAVKKAITSLDGKTVVTADHGNAIGERSKPIPVKEWGHPPGVYMKELVKVPWLEYCKSDRRQINSDPPVSQPDLKESEVEERLAALGYQ